MDIFNLIVWMSAFAIGNIITGIFCIHLFRWGKDLEKKEQQLINESIKILQRSRELDVKEENIIIEGKRVGFEYALYKVELDEDQFK